MHLSLNTEDTLQFMFKKNVLNRHTHIYKLMEHVYKFTAN